MKPYVLENKNEFSRLEKQSLTHLFSYEEELAALELPLGQRTQKNFRILDAGCGSGVVTRFLAQKFPCAQVVGVDQSADRVEAAKVAAKKFETVSFSTQNLTQLDLPNHQFDLIVCRYVLAHMNETIRAEVFQEFQRVLRPGGTLFVIDIDGILANLYPQPPFVQKTIQKLVHSSPSMDLHAGRKLPHELQTLNYSEVSWKIRTLEIRGKGLGEEIQLMKERMVGLKSYLETFLKDEKKATRFATEYLSAMEAPGAVLFYNMFMIQAKKGEKPKPLSLLE